jgi:glycosyltransferase involved in cell wall biosynthesis
MNYPPQPFISVIIPVFNDFERLEVCLEALERQTYPENFYEVIVVDNGSNENIAALSQRFVRVSFAYENTPGSYCARNKGISLAQGEAIAFTDSDCIPAANWLETGVKHLLSVPECGLVAGKIEMFFKNPNQPTVVEIYDSVTFLQQKRNVEEDKYGATANIFTLKSVIEQVGVFNSKLKSGGDLEWGKRVFSHGYSIIYADDVCVAHPARYSFSQVYKKIVRLSGGGYDSNKLEQDERNDYSFRQAIADWSGLKPPLRYNFHKIWSDQRLKNPSQKIQVFVLRLVHYYIKFFEKKRLQVGGGSKR